MIIRVTDARTGDYKGSATWWEQARKNAATGRAPHGIHQLLLDSRVTHIDVFPTEKTQIWDWAAQFEGWVTDGRKQLNAEPFDSTQSNAVHLPDESLVTLRGKNA